MKKVVFILLAICTLIYANIATQKSVSNKPQISQSRSSYARLGAGGPDAYGYRYIDNDTTAPNAPIFNWIDISSTGTLITGLGDDNVVGPINIGFNFPYYWYRVSSFYIGSNGYIAFGDNTMAAATFADSFPNPNRPNNTVAPLMSDFDFTVGAPSCYVWTNATNDTCVITYQNLRWWNQPASNCSLQIILSKPDSSITFQYKRIVGYAGYAGANEGNVTGIENFLGNDGLTYLFNATPAQNALHDELAVKFYPPQTSSYQAYDISIWNAMSDNSGGFFLLNNTATPLWANVINSGNQPVTSCSVYCRISNDTGVVVFSDTIEVASMGIGQKDSVVFAAWTPTQIGTYKTIFRAKIGTDILLSNDSVVIETRVVNYPTELAFDDGEQDLGTSWQGINNGYGMKFYPPTYPCRIVGAKAMLALHGTTPTSCTIFVFKADGPNGGPGTVLGSRHLAISSTTPKWYYLQLDQTITSGAFFVGIVSRADTGEPYFWMDEDPPISRQTWEYTSGWSPSRDLGTRDVMMRAIIGYEPLNIDVSVEEIIAPTGVLVPGAAITPQAVVRNWGLVNQTNIGVVMKIDSLGVPIYTGNASLSLDAGSEDIVTFTPQWIAGPAPTTYDIRVYTTLTGDQNHSNDSMFGMVSSFVTSNYMYANFRVVTPTIDGQIEHLEWADAIKTEVSNVLGHNDGVPKRVGSAYCWMKHDSQYVYVASAMPYADAADLGDQMGIYIDENRNGSWDADTSEGNYWASFRLGSDSTLAFRPLITGGTAVNTHRVYWPDTMAKAGLYNGYVNIECRIPKGTQREYLNLNPVFDTVRYWFFSLDGPNDDWYGWWKTTMTNADAFNPTAYGILFFRNFYYDVGVDKIIKPTGAVPAGTPIIPQVIVTNYGLATTTFPVILTITSSTRDNYYDTVEISLSLGQSDTVEFSEFLPNVGTYTVEAKVEMAGDMTAGNNIKTTTCIASVGGWNQSVSMPTLDPTGKKIKEGGALVTAGNAIYAFKGFKSKEFKMFDGVAWNEKAEIPFATIAGKLAKKYPNKGASLCWTGGNYIYAIKGGGTNEFWKYDISTDVWTLDSLIPTLKGIKGGSSLTYMDGKVYLLAGSQKIGYSNFFEYDPAAGTWTALSSAPLDPLGKKWADGSGLSALNGVVYALKGKDKFNWFFAYTPSGGWTQLESIPLAYDTSMVTKPKKTKVGDGGALTNDGSSLYAIKGGGKQDFWRYNVATNSWTGLTPVPYVTPTAKKSVPKTGAALTYFNNYIWLIKGNKLDEFWKYGPVGSKDDIVQMSSLTETSIMSEINSELKFSFTVTPNPTTNRTMIRFTVPFASNVSIRLYNTAGRLVKSIHNGYANAGHHTISLTDISSGVYFLKYEDATNSKNLKLIVE